MNKKVCHADNQTSSRETTHWSPTLLNVFSLWMDHFNVFIISICVSYQHNMCLPIRIIILPRQDLILCAFLPFPHIYCSIKNLKKKQRICNMGFLNLVRRKESNKIRNMKVYSFDLKAGFEICKRNKNLGFSSPTLWMKVTVFELEKIVKEEYMCKPIPNNICLWIHWK